MCSSHQFTQVWLLFGLFGEHEPVVDAELVLSMTCDEAEARTESFLQRIHHPKDFYGEHCI